MSASWINGKLAYGSASDEPVPWESGSLRAGKLLLLLAAVWMTDVTQASMLNFSAYIWCKWCDSKQATFNRVVFKHKTKHQLTQCTFSSESLLHTKLIVLYYSFFNNSDYFVFCWLNTLSAHGSSLLFPHRRRRWLSTIEKSVWVCLSLSDCPRNLLLHQSNPRSCVLVRSFSLPFLECSVSSSFTVFLSDHWSLAKDSSYAGGAGITVLFIRKCSKTEKQGPKSWYAVKETLWFDFTLSLSC